jgi:hypothetical protein
MSETLMTEPAATAPEGSAASQSEASVTTQASSDQQSLEQQSQQSQAQEGQAESGEDKAASELYGAPEAYQFEANESNPLDPEVMEVYSEVAKELNLSQKAAQSLLDKVGSKIQERTAQNQEQYMQKLRMDWVNQSTTDKEFGGENLQANLSVAKKSLDKFGTPEFRQLINESGLGNHPEFIRFMYRAGKAISEDKFVGRSQGGKATPQSMSDFSNLLYPSQQSSSH